VFQVGFGGYFGDSPIGVFAGEEAMEAFAEFQFASAFTPFGCVGAGKVQQEELAFAPAEELDGQLKFAAL